MLAAIHTSIPSPAEGVWHLGPIPMRAYALCIIVGIVAAIVIGDRRWRARGGRPGTVADVAVWAVPFGIIGGRLYHVITSPQAYFGDGGEPLDAVKIWEGGLGIWGAVALGGVGAWIGCRRRGIALPTFGDAIAPGIAVAQAIGRLGNWFNQELFGRPTDLPWGLEISPENRPAEYADVATFHPTFLYELLWCLGVAALCVWADRRFRMGHGRVFALYVAAYTDRSVLLGTAAHRPGERDSGSAGEHVDLGAGLRGRGRIHRGVGPARPGREDPDTVEPKREEESAAQELMTVPTCRRARTVTCRIATGTSPVAGCARRCSARWTAWSRTSR